MTADVYQHTRADGTPDWTDGRANFESDWEVIRDFARFHRGEGFHWKKRPNDHFRPKTTLGKAHGELSHALASNPAGTVFELGSLADGWSIIMRRVEVETGGDKVVEFAENRLGFPYLLGAAGPDRYDCSGLTLASHAAKAGVALPHKASLQHSLFRGGNPGFLTISRSQVKRGDLIFSNGDEHVAMYYGEHRGVECVIDTEPHDTAAPWGGMLGTGIRVRPMTGNYYNSWTRVNGLGRVVAVNGRP